MSGTERTHRHRRKWGPGGKEGFEKGDRRGGQESFIDLYNRLAAQYGPAVTDLMVGGPHTPFAVHAALSWISDDRDLWFEATGQRVSELRAAERLALECWLWETHDRQRQEQRYKPKKSPKHDEPWPNPPLRWAPRRWFRSDILPALRKLFPGLTRNPLQISVSRALNRERANARAELATEIASEEFHQSLDGEWESTSTAPIAERNHPNPQGYWWVKVEGIKPDSLIRLLWPNYPQPKWEPCDDEDSPESVLLQKHEPPKGIVESSVPLRTPTTERGLYDAIRRYRLAWKAAGCPAYWQARAAPHTTRAESTPEKCPGAWALRHVEAPADALSAKRKECRRRCDAAIDGLLSNFGCDDLDRLTTSAAIEAA